MPTEHSPGGSTFPYYYKGGEIHALKYGSYFSDEEALLAVMRAEEHFIAGKHRRLRIWVDFYETRLTDTVLAEFTAQLGRLSEFIVRMAIVGMSRADRRRLRRLARRSAIELPAPLRYFDDPEDAKTWLVTEGPSR